MKNTKRNKMGISARIIADSLGLNGTRLTTFILTFPRIVLAEFNTHRMLSRNSASSRAIPFKKMLRMVWEDPFIPIKWMKDHSGMQGDSYFTGGMRVWLLTNIWLLARTFAIGAAWTLSKLGLTKQIVNRLLEPFMWHTAIVTGTEWENFFALRADEPAEIHIQELAYHMLRAYNSSTPVQLKEGEWHMPFGDRIYDLRIWKLLYGDMPFALYDTTEEQKNQIREIKLKIATARCARVSYASFDGKDDYKADIKLHDRLERSGHWSPFEHCARVMSEQEFQECVNGCAPMVNHGTYGNLHLFRESSKGWCGNFRGFKQYRKMFENENKTDNRVKK